LAETWQEILQVDRVVLEDNFFDSGGHSLTAIDAIRRVHQQTGYRFEVREFIMETLEQLAAKLDRASSVDVVSAPSAVPENEGRGVLNRLMRRLSGKQT